MAIAHPFILTQYQAALGAGQALLMSQGAQTPIDFAIQIRGTTSLDNVIKSSFAWGGNIYLPMGTIQSVSQGWFSYNPNSAEFELATTGSMTRKMIPFGEYVAHIIAASSTQRGTHPFNVDVSPQTPSAIGFEDHVAFGQELLILGATAQKMSTWSYPFAVAPSTVSLAMNLGRVVVFKNKVYVIALSTGTSWLWEWQGGTTWNQVGSGFTLTEAASSGASTPSQISAFEFNSKLWLLVRHTSAGTFKVRVYEVDEALGTVTDRSSTHLPTAWKAATAFNDDRLLEVIDDVGTSRQVYIIRCGSRINGGWELIDFQDGTNTIDGGNSGGHAIWPYCGTIWNTTAKGAHIKSAVDSSPSSRVEMQIAVSDLVTQGNVSIDPRYNDISLTTEAPPYNQCTELQGQGSEGKTGLASKPSGITTLVDLSDAFGDGVIDVDLWETVYPSINFSSWDRAALTFTNAPKYEIEEILAAQNYLRLGGTSPVPASVTDSGIGLMGKWYLTGAFQVDVKIFNLANLTSDAGRGFSLVLFIKSATNRGAYIRVFRTAAGAAGLFARAGYAQDDVNIVDGPDSVANPVDGDIIRLARTAGDVWSAILDPLGDNENIDPGIPNITGPVRIWLFAHTDSAGNWTTSDDAPGFYDLAASGAGALGKYESEVNREFHWDHLGDLGAGINKAFELHVDTD